MRIKRDYVFNLLASFSLKIKNKLSGKSNNPSN